MCFYGTDATDGMRGDKAGVAVRGEGFGGLPLC